MAFYDKRKTPPSGGAGSHDKRASEREGDEHAARRAQSPKERESQEANGRPRWMERPEESGGGGRGGSYGSRPGSGYNAPRGGDRPGGFNGPRGGGGDRPGGFNGPRGGGDRGGERPGGFGGPRSGGDRGGPPRGPREGMDRGDRPAYAGRPQAPSGSPSFTMEDMEAMVRRVVRQELEMLFKDE